MWCHILFVILALEELEHLVGTPGKTGFIVSFGFLDIIKRCVYSSIDYKFLVVGYTTD